MLLFPPPSFFPYLNFFHFYPSFPSYTLLSLSSFPFSFPYFLPPPFLLSLFFSIPYLPFSLVPCFLHAFLYPPYLLLPPVPPVITSHPPSFHEIRGNQPFTLIVEFQSRFRENTTVTWYLNGSTLPEGRVHTQYSSKLDGRTILQLDPITRSDKGVYEVVVRNSFGIIPLQMRENETSFQMSIIGKWCIKVLAQWGTSV